MIKNNKGKILILFSILIIVYGFYEKNRRQNLYTDFRSYKNIICENKVINKNKGFRIHNNRFFTNGTNLFTIVHCKSEGL